MSADGLSDNQRRLLRNKFGRGMGLRQDWHDFVTDADLVAASVDVRNAVLADYRRAHGLDLSDDDRAAAIRARVQPLT